MKYLMELLDVVEGKHAYFLYTIDAINDCIDCIIMQDN